MGHIGNKSLTEEYIASNHNHIYSQLIPLLQNSPSNLDALIQVTSVGTVISETSSKAHCYFISLDGNKRPRVNDLARYVGQKIVDYAIPRSEKNRALNEAVNLNSFQPVAALNSKAISLFTTLPKSGEGGEVLLSVLAETFLQLPQLFSKMVLKTNTEMHVHGSDGIHVGVNESNGNLALYWGESKLYADATSAAYECFSSLAPFLLDSGGSSATQERDLQLMREGLDLDNPELEEALKKYLNPQDVNFNKLEFRGLCLIGFSSDSYPSKPNSKELHELAEEINDAFHSRLSHLGKRIKEETLDSFVIEIICLPLPCVDEFRNAFRSELGL